jgi:hypothetical protein
MADLKLDILVLPTYNVLTLGIADASTYPDDPPIVVSPTIEITVPNFGLVVLPFVVNDFNLFNSASLEITEVGINQPLPDGIYKLRYSIAPAYENYVDRTIMRTEKIQEKFDRAFLQLDLIECDRAIKTQSSVTLNTINFFIQGSIAAANNCAEYESNKLYTQANNMLDSFLKSNCGCSGNNYQLNFY